MDICAETIKEFKGCAIQSKISDSAHSNSKEQVDTISDSKKVVDNVRNSEELVDAVSNPNIDTSSDPKVASYTTNKHFPQKLFKNRFVPQIIPGAIRSIDQMFTEDVPGI